MQTSLEQNQPTMPRIIPFLIYLFGGVLIFLLGVNTFDLFPTNRNVNYEWGLAAFLLLLTVILQRLPRWRVLVKLTGALFIAAMANVANLALGNFLGQLLHKTGNDFQSLSIDKLSQVVPIVLAVILLSLWMGGDLGSLFLKRGNLRQGLQFGLISFAVFAVIFAVIVVVQSNAAARQGLFASGVSVNTVIRNIPWILLFCFANSFMEELWFRGVSLGKLTPLVGRTLAIVVTALVFGLSHIGATYVTPLEMFIFPVIVFACGLVNAHMMLNTDSIWGSIFFHAGYDLLVVLPVIVSH